MKRASFALVPAALCLAAGLCLFAAPEQAAGAPAQKTRAAAPAVPPEETRRFAEALEAYKQNPGAVQAALDFAGAALAVGQPQLAASVYERLAEKNLGGEAVLDQLIDLNYRMNNPQKAAYWQYYKEAARTGTLQARSYGPQKRLEIGGKLFAGALYDSNANSGPSSNTMNLGRFMDVTIDGAKEISTFGAYFGGRLDLAYRPENSQNWQVVGDAGFYLRGNENNDLRNAKNRYTQWGRAAAGARYMDQRNLLDVRLKTEIYDYECNEHVGAIGPEFMYLRAVTPSFQLITNAGIDLRDYSKSSYRNGTYGWAGQYARFFLGGAPYADQGDNRRHEFFFGARYLGGSADESRYSYDGWEGLARFGIKLPRKVELSPYISFTQEFYDGPATALEYKKREDDRVTMGLNASWDVTEHWTLEAGYQYIHNTSTSNLHDYDRHVVTMGVAYNF